MLRNIGVVVTLVLLSSTGLAAANNPSKCETREFNQLHNIMTSHACLPSAHSLGRQAGG